MNATELLLAARRNPAQRLARLPEPPADAAAAYAIQRAVMAELGEIGGWKVGSPSPDGPISCAPLPASFIVASPARIPPADCPDLEVEPEIAVLMGTALPARDEPYAAGEVLGAIASAHPALELLQSRFADADAAGPLSNLADSGGHFGLVWGEAVDTWEEIDLAAGGVRLTIGGREAKQGRGNPGGDIVRLLTWLANDGARWAGGLKAGAFVTTGSWTGKDPVPASSRVRAVFDCCGTVEAIFE